jgi:hypothetical protein
LKELAATSNGWKIITKSSMPGYRSKNNEKNKKKLKQKPENKQTKYQLKKNKKTNKQTKTKQQRILNHARIHSDTVCKNKR